VKRILISDANLQNVAIKEVILEYRSEKSYTESIFQGTTQIHTHINYNLVATVLIENKNTFPVDATVDFIVLNPDNTQSFDSVPPSISMRNLRPGIGKHDIVLSRFIHKYHQVRLTKMSVLVDNVWSSQSLDKIIYDKKIKPRKPMSTGQAILLTILVGFVAYKAISYTIEKKNEVRYRGVYAGVASRDSNVRSAPGSDGKVIYQIKKGMNVIITDTISGPEFTFDGRKAKYFKIVQSHYYVLYPEDATPLWVWGGNVEYIQQYRPSKLEEESY